MRQKDLYNRPKNKNCLVGLHHHQSYAFFNLRFSYFEWLRYQRKKGSRMVGALIAAKASQSTYTHAWG